MPEIDEVQTKDPSPTTRRSRHIYGGKGALTIESARSSDASRLVFMIDAAMGSQRQYDWNGKSIIQLTDNEGLMVFAVLMGLVRCYETAPHGDSGKKFSIADQDDKFFCRLMDRNKTVAVPMSPLDAAQVALLIGEAFVRECPVLVDMEGLVKFARAFVTRVPVQQLQSSDAPSGARQQAPSSTSASKSPTAAAMTAAAVQPSETLPTTVAKPASAAAPATSPKPKPTQPAKRFDVTATIGSIKRKQRLDELDGVEDHLSGCFEGDELQKVLEAVKHRREELSSVVET